MERKTINTKKTDEYDSDYYYYGGGGGGGNCGSGSYDRMAVQAEVCAI